MTLLEQYLENELPEEVCTARCNELLDELIQWDLYAKGPDDSKVCEYLISMDERMAEADIPAEEYALKMAYVKASILSHLETVIGDILSDY